MEEEISEIIFRAIAAKDPEDLSTALDGLRDSTDLDHPDWRFGNGCFPLFAAINAKSSESCQLLLESGADPNIQDSQGLTPTHYAVKIRNVEILELLFQYGANANITDNLKGHTPLLQFCFSLASNKPLCKTKEDILFLLLERSEINVTGFQKMSPLHILVSKNQDAERVIDPICRIPGIDIDQQNEEGETPLMVALERDFTDLASYFLSKDCDLTKCNKHAETPLLIACRKNQAELVLKMLETNRCPTRNRDLHDNSAFHVAASRGFEEIVRILIVYANLRLLEKVNHLGKTPIELAKEGKFEAVTKLLMKRSQEKTLLL